jgi:hypothetical protein
MTLSVFRTSERRGDMPTITPEDRLRKTREAFRLANDLHLDLLTGTRIRDLLQKMLAAKPASEMIQIGIRRMCLWYVILTLSKWVEYYDNYKSFIPSEVQSQAKNLRNEIERRGIRDFRNNTVGHVWDDITKMPITMKETEARIQQILGSDDIDGFMRWVNHPTDNQFPGNVVMVVERVRNQIREINGFTESDLI